MGRPGLTKQKRFNVFKRDAFRCQYCGKFPPDCILEVDHVVPVSEGGADEMHNLLTACFDCNRGKAAGTLDTLPPSVDSNMECEIERRAQMEAFNRWLMAGRKKTEKAIESIRAYWGNLVHPNEPGKWFLNVEASPSLRTFLSALPEAKILEAIDIAFSKPIPEHARWKYFCGICWRTIKNDGRKSSHG